ncbi:MAG: nucleotidyltransferase domain-containing protein [Spirochaetaceae bacterium]|nr:nucleotidyltransferase domain-containing protein [Spirochaetaceae bacterium]
MIDLPERHLRLVRSLLARRIPGVPVWAFGSRITGASRPASDLDLAVFSSPGDYTALHDLRDDFAESDLPFRIDLLEWQSLPENFRRNIESRHEIVQ